MIREANPTNPREKYLIGGGEVDDGDKQLLRRLLRQGGGGSQTKDMQVMYACQVLRRHVSTKSLAEAQNRLQTTCRPTTR